MFLAVTVNLVPTLSLTESKKRVRGILSAFHKPLFTLLLLYAPGFINLVFVINLVLNNGLVLKLNGCNSYRMVITNAARACCRNQRLSNP
jgi:hypothetical protein